MSRRPGDPDRERRRQKDGRQIHEQLMDMLAPSSGVPQVDQRMNGEECCGRLCRRSRAAAYCEPHEACPCDEISSPDVADEVRIKRAGIRNARHQSVPGIGNRKHG